MTCLMHIASLLIYCLNNLFLILHVYLYVCALYARYVLPFLFCQSFYKYLTLHRYVTSSLIETHMQWEKLKEGMLQWNIEPINYL